MFNLIVKDPSGAPPKWCRFWIEAFVFTTPVSPNLLRRLDLAPSAHRPVSLATFPILPAFRFAVKPFLFSGFRRPQPTQNRDSISLRPEALIRTSRYANLLKNDQRTKRLSHLGSREINLSGLTMACSLWDSLQGLLGITHQTLRTSFPLPSSGRLYSHRKAPLLLTVSLQLFKSIKLLQLLQACRF